MPAFAKGDVELHFGDCLEMMKRIPSHSVDMVLADLPYGMTRCKWDCPLPLDALWEQYLRVCRGPILLFAATPFDKMLGASNIAMLKYEWIWEKSNATGFLNAKRAPLRAHENILVFYKKQPTYTPIKTSGHVRKVTKRTKNHGAVYGAQTETSYDSTERYPRSVLRFPSDKQRGAKHPTPKPVALCEYLIKTYTEPGAVVLDNVMGSGSTGVAALACGRRFIGIEIEARFFRIAQERMGLSVAKPRSRNSELECRP